MVLEWDQNYTFHFVGDSKFGTMDYFDWRKDMEYYWGYTITLRWDELSQPFV
jgi:hypothetical protein